MRFDYTTDRIDMTKRMINAHLAKEKYFATVKAFLSDHQSYFNKGFTITKFTTENTDEI